MHQQGAHEAVELRDGDPTRFLGKGVLSAIENIETVIARALKGVNARSQAEVDQIMIDLPMIVRPLTFGLVGWNVR